MNRRSWFAVALGVGLALAVGTAMAGMLTPNEQLGKSILFDENLSINRNQSCATCHGTEWGGTGPDAAINAGGSVYEGSIAGRFGDRKPPSTTYATTAPIFHFEKGLWVGGNFWDGRATGYKLGNPAADQAQGPFLNPVEQGLPDSACVVYRVCVAMYPVSFEDVWGSEACDIAWPMDTDMLCGMEGSHIPLSEADRGKSNLAYDQIALSIAAYEGSFEINAFNSKWDWSRMDNVGLLSREARRSSTATLRDRQMADGLSFGLREGVGSPVDLNDMSSPDRLTKEERRGFALFQGKGKCKACHVTQGEKPLLTDYTFDNLGLPKNPANPVYNVNPGFVDEGLGAFLRASGYPPEVWEPEIGKHKVPTARNVDRRPLPTDLKAYGHNGYFKSLKGIVHFYNTRDVKPMCPGDYTEAQALAENCWPAPEVPVNVNTAELGNLGLTDEEEDAIVAFLKTLSDGYFSAD